MALWWKSSWSNWSCWWQTACVRLCGMNGAGTNPAKAPLSGFYNFYLFSSCQIISFLQNTFQTNKKLSLESAVFRLYLRTPVFARKWMNFRITLWSSLLVFEFSVAHFPPILAKRGIPKKQRIHPMSKCLIFYQGRWKQFWQLHPRKEIHTLMDVHLFKRSVVFHWGNKKYIF